MSYRGVNAVRLDEVLNFDGFFVFDVIELESGGDDFSQRDRFFAAFDKLNGGTYKAVRLGPRATRVTSSLISGFLKRSSVVMTYF